MSDQQPGGESSTGPGPAEVRTVDAGPRAVSRRVEVPAPAADVFALVAAPSRHHELDGSGTVGEVVTGPERLSAGARFSVRMKQLGVPYTITSTVTGFEQDRLVEWRHPLGHRWRWELRQVSPGVTEVTETFDYSGARAPRALEAFGVHFTNATGITRTLQRLAARFAPALPVTEP